MTRVYYGPPPRALHFHWWAPSDARWWTTPETRPTWTTQTCRCGARRAISTDADAGRSIPWAWLRARGESIYSSVREIP